MMEKDGEKSIYKNRGLEFCWKGIAKGNLNFIKRGTNIYRKLMSIEVETVRNTIQELLPFESSAADENENEEGRTVQNPSNYCNKGKLYIILLLGLVMIFKRQVEFFAEDVRRLYMEFHKRRPAAVEVNENGEVVPKKRQRRSSTSSSTTRENPEPDPVELNFDNNFGEPTFGPLLPLFDGCLLPSPGPRGLPGVDFDENDDFDFTKPNPSKRKKTTSLGGDPFEDDDADLRNELKKIAESPDNNLLKEVDLDSLQRPLYSEGFYDGTTIDPRHDEDAIFQGIFAELEDLDRSVDQDKEGENKDQDQEQGNMDVDMDVEIIREEKINESHSMNDDDEVSRRKSVRVLKTNSWQAINLDLKLEPLKISHSQARKLKRINMAKYKSKSKSKGNFSFWITKDEKFQIEINREKIKAYTNRKKDSDKFLDHLRKKKVKFETPLKKYELLKGMDFIKKSGRNFISSSPFLSIAQKLGSSILHERSKAMKEGQLPEVRDLENLLVTREFPSRKSTDIRSCNVSLNESDCGKDMFSGMTTFNSGFNNAQIGQALDIMDDEIDQQSNDNKSDDYTFVGEELVTRGESRFEENINETENESLSQSQTSEKLILNQYDTQEGPRRKKRKFEQRVENILTNRRNKENVKRSSSDSSIEIEMDRVFTDLCPPSKTSRFIAAQSFFTLLKMQKERKIELVQEKFGGPITINNFKKAS